MKAFTKAIKELTSVQKKMALILLKLNGKDCAMEFVKQIAELRVQNTVAKNALDIISQHIECWGPDCPYCESEDEKHPFSYAAEIAQKALEKMR